jgi:hypothetical protein
MALLTLGSAATTSLAGQLWNAAILPADRGAISAAILDDLNPAHPTWPGALAAPGLLYVPNRGVLKILPGDYVAYDATTGWPILLSARAIAAGPWVHS